MKTNSLFRALFAVASAALLVTQLAVADSPREHLSLDANWKFHFGDDRHFSNRGTASFLCQVARIAFSTSGCQSSLRRVPGSVAAPALVQSIVQHEESMCLCPEKWGEESNQ